MKCIEECPVLNIFAIDGCPCQESMRVSNLEAYARGPQTNSKHGNEREQVTATDERRATEPQMAGQKASGVSWHRRGKTGPAELPFSDPACGARWSGHGTSHCMTCHCTFTGVGPFDKHRKTGVCVDPASIGLAVNPDRNGEVWGSRRATERETK